MEASVASKISKNGDRQRSSAKLRHCPLLLFFWGARVFLATRNPFAYTMFIAYCALTIPWRIALDVAAALASRRGMQVSHDRFYSIAASAAAMLLPIAPLFGAGPTFRPDTTFKGSTLAAWHTLGPADWKAQNGEITGSARAGAQGGWLVLNHSYQDAAFYSSFRCAKGCNIGVLLRAEKTPQGIKGIFVSLNAEEVAPYRISLDADGRELSREKLRSGSGMWRIAPPPDPNAPARPAAGRGRGAAGPVLPVTRPSTAYRPDDWNQAEILIDENMVHTFLNTGGDNSGVTGDDDGGYGPLALYVGGTGEVTFKDISYKNLAIRETPIERVSPNFRIQRLSPFYYAWGAAAADFNHDGILDIVAGPYIYLGPDFTKRSEIYPAVVRNPGTQFSTDCWMTFAADFTGDGWPDVVTASHDNDGGPGGDRGVWLYVNPKGESRRWEKHLVVPTFQSEIATVKDIDGDGKPEFVYMADGFVRYAKPDPANPTGPWVVHTISERGYATAHGIGVGDINGDGRMDILNAYGWWEQPPAGSSQELWTYHPQAFGQYVHAGAGGSVMAVYDVNGDGLNDVVTVLSAHGYGLAWYEQKRDGAGRISFVEHMIMGDPSAENAGNVSFSEPHGSTFADVDGDGIPDFIVGKRYWAHKDSYLDPDPNGPAVLYVYKTVRDPKAPGGAKFVPELIHNWSGAGSDVLAVDLNKDGAMDIVTATKLGLYVFWGKPRPKPASQLKK